MTLPITILVLGLLASLSPSTIVVFILLLDTTRARVNATAFLIGWIVSLIVVFGLAYVVGGGSALRQGNGRTAVDAVEILLGVGLTVLGVRQWRIREQPRSPSGFTKGFTGRLRELRPMEAAIVGVLKQPWALTAAAAMLVVRDSTAVVAAIIALVVFTLASTATVALTFLYYARRPGEAKVRLAELRTRLARAGPAVLVAVSLVVGAYLIAHGAAELTSA